MLTAWEQTFLATQRVARLATLDAQGQPHVLPIVFACDGQRFVTPLDGKHKHVDVMQLQRVRNLQANPRVAVILDQYDEDWTQLAWLQIRGQAALLFDGADYDAGIAALARKYPQYATVALAGRPLIQISLDVVRSWRAADARAINHEAHED